jgi:hypothetical protein
LKQAQKEKLIKIENAAVLHKDAKGKLQIMETADQGSDVLWQFYMYISVP